MKLFEHIQTLYEHELYEDLVFLHEMIPHCEGLSAKHEALMAVYVADAYYELEKYPLSLLSYFKALQLYPEVSRSIHNKHFSDTEVRFRYHKCLVKEKKFEEALAVLAKISGHQYIPKVRYAMAKLLAGKDHKGINISILYLQDVFTHCKSAFGSLAIALRNGASTACDIDIDAVGEGMEGSTATNLVTWLEAQKLLGSGQPEQALKTMSLLGTNNPKILTEMGLIYNTLGMRHEARSELSKAHSLDSEQHYAMDTLALLFAQNSPPMAKELESLATHLMNSDENTVEAWIAFGHCARCQGKLKTALYFAHKACSKTTFGDRPKSEAMMLKAYVLLDLERFDDAMRHLSAAIKRDVKNIDLYELQIVTYLQRAKIREARAAVAVCMQNLPSCPRARVLKAQVLLASPNGKEEAQAILEEVVFAHPYLLEAVWLLISQYDATHNYQKGVEMLKKLTEVISRDIIYFICSCRFILKNSMVPYHSMGRLHHQLGEFLSKTGMPAAAYHHTNLALTKHCEEATVQMSHLEPTLSFHTPPMPTTPTCAPSECPGAPRLRGRQRHSTPSSTSTIGDSEGRGVRMFSFDSSIDEITEAMDVPSEG
ncbi:tetratricopeptide repeat protein [Dictyocaulus viviparus]|uniref:Tetratricopeptide repeat protein n=1 Tax=Dictyocaulus viviparus TaxID=29172 RepID=A0A0D8Y7E5_DICVI|nr:tetratricopeptide repeat protein [Dictyocaulus viviparus]